MKYVFVLSLCVQVLGECYRGAFCEQTPGAALRSDRAGVSNLQGGPIAGQS